MKTFPALALLLLTAAAPAPDTLRDRLIADARALAPPTIAYDRATSTTQVAKSGESEAERRSDRWSGKTWTLLTVDGKPVDAEAVANYAKSAKDQIIPGYYRLGLFLTGATAKSTDAQGRTVYHIATMPKGSVTVGGDVSDKMAADVIVDTSGAAPMVTRLHVFAKEPFRIMLVAKIDSFDTVSDYARGADGRPALVRSANTITGSQFGKDGTQKTEAVFSNVRAVDGR